MASSGNGGSPARNVKFKNAVRQIVLTNRMATAFTVNIPARAFLPNQAVREGNTISWVPDELSSDGEDDDDQHSEEDRPEQQELDEDAPEVASSLPPLTPSITTHNAQASTQDVAPPLPFRAPELPFRAPPLPPRAPPLPPRPAQPSLSDLKKVSITGPTLLMSHTWKRRRWAVGKTCIHCYAITHASTLQCTVCAQYIHEKCAAGVGACWDKGGKHPPITGKDHAFVLATFMRPTYCALCHHLLKGVAVQGEECIECSYTVHRDCRNLAQASCTSASHSTVLNSMQGAKNTIVGYSMRTEGFRAHYPVVLIPGLCSSGLTIEKSEEKPSWEGDRLWININKLGGQGLFKKNNVSLIGDGVTLAEASAQQGNAWLRHMCLDYGVDDPPGIRVRPMEGIDAVDFLIPGALTGAASYVFSELIEQLRFVGYTNANLIAAPYDWRLAPSRLEEKTSYFTKLADKIEVLYEANGDTPVVLFGHSMGVMCTTYFLRFVERQRGNEWIQTHVHKFMAAGGPWLGAYKTIRSSVIGENFDLPFVNSSEALLMCRSMSSAPWLHPRGPCVENDFIYVREEGNFTLGPFIIRLCERFTVLPKTSVYLKGKIGQTSVEGQAEAEDGTYVCKGRQMLRSQFPGGPLETEVLKFTLRVGKTAIAETEINCKEFTNSDDVLAKNVYMYAPLSAEEPKRRISLSKKDAHKYIDEERSVVADMLIRIAFTPDVCIEREPDLQIKTRKGKLLRYKTRHDTNKFLVECGAGAIRDIVQRDYEGDTILDNYLTCPPVARLVNVYGINLPTEAGYAFRIQQGTLDSCLFTKYKLDKAFRTDTHKCVDGTLYENKHTVQKQRDGTRKCSGDGTVTYQSLSYPLTWEDDEKTTVENHEFENMEHRAMLADPRLHEVLIKHVCKMNG